MNEIIREEAIREVQFYAWFINRDKYLEQVVNKIYNYHEAQLKAKEIKRLNNLYADTIKELGEAVMEIDRLNEAYTAITNNFECALMEIDRLKEKKHNG